MSKHKAIPKKTRIELYEKYNHKCAYCGCDLDYKDMQVDHVKSVYSHMDFKQTMTEEEIKKRYNIPPSLLDEYKRRGLCGEVKKVMDDWQFDESDIEELLNMPGAFYDTLAEAVYARMDE